MAKAALPTTIRLGAVPARARRHFSLHDTHARRGISEGGTGRDCSSAFRGARRSLSTAGCPVGMSGGAGEEQAWSFRL